MNANGSALSTADCFAQFDEAFARLEADLVSAERAQTPRTTLPRADLAEYEEAFTNIDRQLDHPGRQPASCAGAVDTPTDRDVEVAAPSRPSLALVPPVQAASTEAPRAIAVVYRESEELWRRPIGGGTPLERLVTTVQNLLWLQRTIHARSSRIADRVRWQDVAEVLSDARQLCSEFDLPSARVRADFALAALEEDRLDLLASESGELVRHIRHDLQSCSVAPIARARAWMFNVELSERAAKAFPSACADVTEGGRSAGFGLHNATVFHMLRAANSGRHALTVAVRVKRPTTESADWSAMVTQLEAKLAETQRWTAGVAKTTAAAFYESLLNDARVLHDANRKLASGDMFDEHHALMILQTTRSFLNRLAEHVTERQDRPLGRKDFGGANRLRQASGAREAPPFSF